MGSRHFNIVNLTQFSRETHPISAGQVTCRPSVESQMILRMLVDSPTSGFRVPQELQWLLPALEKAKAYQSEKVGVKHPYTYITVRHGVVTSKTDDAWHVDGFSTRITHLPEANYIFSFGDHPTEWLDQTFDFPEDFDPRQHNVHQFFQRRADTSRIRVLQSGEMAFIDPYVIHRRPPITQDTYRTFVRISFTPIEIPDVENTRNPLIETPHYTNDGVGARNLLRDYDAVSVL